MYGKNDQRVKENKKFNAKELKIVGKSSSEDAESLSQQELDRITDEKEEKYKILKEFFQKNRLNTKISIIEKQEERKLGANIKSIENFSIGTFAEFKNLIGGPAAEKLIDCSLSLDNTQSQEIKRNYIAVILANDLKESNIVEELKIVSQYSEEYYIKSYLSRLEGGESDRIKVISCYRDNGADKVLKAIFEYYKEEKHSAINGQAEFSKPGSASPDEHTTREQLLTKLEITFKLLDNFNNQALLDKISAILNTDILSIEKIKNYLHNNFQLEKILKEIAKQNDIEESIFFNYFNLVKQGQEATSQDATSGAISLDRDNIVLPLMKNSHSETEKDNLLILKELRLSTQTNIEADSTENISYESDMVIEVSEISQKEEITNLDVDEVLKDILDVLDEPIKIKLKEKADSIEEYFNSFLNSASQSKISDLKAEEVQQWAIKQKGKLSSNGDEEAIKEICQAIAILDRANQLATGGHRLHYPQKIAILLFMGAVKEQAIISQVIGLKEKTGHISQIITGEGKTTIISFVGALRVLQGEIVDVITSNEVLAKNAADGKALFYKILDIKVSHNNYDKKYSDGPRSCYTADIVYGSINNFQFDYINHHYLGKDTLGEQRQFNNQHKKLVILDEIDSLLIDQGGNIAKISSPIPGMETLKYIYINIWKALITAETEIVSQLNSQEQNLGRFEQQKNRIREEIKSKKEQIINKNVIVKYLYNYVDKSFDVWVENAMLARFTYKKDIQYKIKYRGDEKFIALIDYSSTGTSMHNSVLSQGLHQFLQLENNVALTYESLTSSFISNLGYIKNYNNNILGLTGTLGSTAEQELLSSVYNLDFSIVPTYKIKKLENFGISIIKDEKFLETLAYKALHIGAAKKRAVLIVCANIMDAKALYKQIAAIIKIAGLSEKLNIIKYISESDERAATGKEIMPGDIIVATNIAGRGTDFVTSQGLERNGGLHEITAFLPNSERTQDQASGRTGRQGNEGSTEIYIRESEVKDLALAYEQNELGRFNWFMKDSPEFSKYIINVRDELEAQRLNDIKENKKIEIEFQDELGRLFGEKYTELKKKSEKNGKKSDEARKWHYVLQDLNAKWAFWLNEQDFSSQNIKQNMLKAEDEFKLFIEEEQVQEILGAKVSFNPYYGIALAEYYLREGKDKEAEIELLNALHINGEESKDYPTPLLYGAYLKLVEISINSGHQYMYRFMKIVGSLVATEPPLAPLMMLLNNYIVQQDEEYKNKALKWIKKAEQAIENELDYYSKIIYGKAIPNSKDEINKLLANNKKAGVNIEVLMLEEMVNFLKNKEIDINPYYLCIGIGKQNNINTWLPGFLIKENCLIKFFYLKFKGIESYDLETKLGADFTSVQFVSQEIEADIIPNNSGPLAITNLGLMINNDDTKQLTKLFRDRAIDFAKEINIEDLRKYNLALDYLDTICSIFVGSIDSNGSDSSDEEEFDENNELVNNLALSIDNYNVDFIVHVSQEQDDDNSCGPMAINNLLIMAKKFNDDGIDKLIEQFSNINFTRQEQVDNLRQNHNEIVQADSQTLNKRSIKDANIWYSDDEIGTIVRNRFSDISSANINVNTQVYERMTLDTINIFIKDKQELKEENKPVFVCFNIGGSTNQNSGIHWIAMSIVNYKGKLTILYKDSKGDFNSKAASIANEFKKYWPNSNLQIENKVDEQHQKELVNGINNIDLTDRDNYKNQAGNTAVFNEEELEANQDIVSERVPNIFNNHNKDLKYAASSSERVINIIEKQTEKLEDEAQNNKLKNTKAIQANNFIEHINARYHALEISTKMIRTLKNTLETEAQNNNQNYGLVVDAKIFNFLDKYNSAMDQTEQEIYSTDVADLQKIGLDSAFQLKKVYDAPEAILSGIKIQLILGCQLYGTVYGAPIGNAIIAEGLSDLAGILIDYTGETEFKWEDYLLGKAVSYGISILAMGLNKISVFSKFFKATSFAGETTTKLFISTTRGIVISVITEKALNFVFTHALQGIKPLIEVSVKEAVEKKFKEERSQYILSKTNGLILRSEVNKLFDLSTEYKMLKAGYDIGFGAVKRVGNWKIQLAALITETAIESYCIYYYTSNSCDRLFISLAELMGESKKLENDNFGANEIEQLKAQISAVIYQRIVSLASKVVNTLATILYTRHQEKENKRLEDKQKEFDKLEHEKSCELKAFARAIGLNPENQEQLEKATVIFGLVQENGAGVMDVENALRSLKIEGIETKEVDLKNIRSIETAMKDGKCTLHLSRSEGEIGHAVHVENKEGVLHVIESDGKAIPLSQYLAENQNQFTGAKATSFENDPNLKNKITQLVRNRVWSSSELRVAGQEEGENFGGPHVISGSKGHETKYHLVGKDGLKVILETDNTKLRNAIAVRDASNACLKGLCDNGLITAGMVQTLVETDNEGKVLGVSISISGNQPISEKAFNNYKESMESQLNMNGLKHLGKNVKNNIIKNLQVAESEVTRNHGKKHFCALDNSASKLSEINSRNSIIIGGEVPMTKETKSNYGPLAHSCNSCHQATEHIVGSILPPSGHNNQAGGRKSRIVSENQLKRTGAILEIDLRKSSIDYWFNYQELNLDIILKMRLDSLGYSGSIKIVKPIVIETENFLDSQLISLQKEIIISSINNILIPVLILQDESLYHWIGLVATKNNHNINITYLDSENQLASFILQNTFLGGLQKLFSNSKVTFKQQALETQRYNNCGPELVENFIYYLTGTRATQEAAIYLHSLLYENSILDLEFSAPQILDNNRLIAELSNQMRAIYYMPSGYITREFLFIFQLLLRVERMEITSLATNIFDQESIGSDIPQTDFTTADENKVISVIVSSHHNTDPQNKKPNLELAETMLNIRNGIEFIPIFSYFIKNIAYPIVQGALPVELATMNLPEVHLGLLYAGHAGASYVGALALNIASPFESALTASSSYGTRLVFKEVVHNIGSFDLSNNINMAGYCMANTALHFIPELMQLYYFMNIGQFNYGGEIIGNLLKANTLTVIQRFTTSSLECYNTYKQVHNLEENVETKIEKIIPYMADAVLAGTSLAVSYNPFFIIGNIVAVDISSKVVLKAIPMEIKTSIELGLTCLGTADNISNSLTNMYDIYWKGIENEYSFKTYHSCKALADFFVQFTQFNWLNKIHDFTSDSSYYSDKIIDIIEVKKDQEAEENQNILSREFGEEKAKYIFKYISKPGLDIKYDLLKQAVLGVFTEAEYQEKLQKINFSIDIGDTHYDLCINLNNNTNKGNDRLSYNCYSKENDIIDHIITDGAKLIELYHLYSE